MKEVIVHPSYIKEVEQDRIFRIYEVCCRNGDENLSLGDKLENAEIIKIEAYGQTLPMLGSGMTGRLTLRCDGELSFCLKQREPDPEFEAWCDRRREERLAEYEKLQNST